MFFPNKGITIFRELPHGTNIGINEDGSPKLLDCGFDGIDNIPNCLNKLEVVIGDFQPRVSREIQEQFGHITQNLYMLYLDIYVDIEYQDKVEVEGYEGRFQVIGHPNKFTSLQPHIECVLMKER